MESKYLTSKIEVCFWELFDRKNVWICVFTIEFQLNAIGGAFVVVLLHPVDFFQTNFQIQKSVHFCEKFFQIKKFFVETSWEYTYEK